MALININNSKIISRSILGIDSVSFNYTGQKATAIQPIQKLAGVFTSSDIIADDGFLRWHDVEWSGDQTDFNIAIYVRDSDKSLTNEKWFGPFYNKDFSIGFLKGKYLQFMAVLCTDSTTVPKINQINLRYITSASATKFYTKAFELGFNPETILLTYNSDITDDTVIRFAVSGEDSTDILDYQYIEPNKIESLTDLSIYSDKIKVLMELSGEFNADVNVHEFALILSGDEVTRINKISQESSSSSLSSESESSSSSSMDSSSSSSSSSSEDYSESSSSSS